jgi:hypothetical protein
MSQPVPVVKSETLSRCRLRTSVECLDRLPNPRYEPDA